MHRGLRLLTALGVAFSATLSQLEGTGPENLQGKELEKVERPESFVQPGVSGAIQTAVVTEDGATRLRVKVTCSALQGMRVWGYVRGTDERVQREIRNAPERIPPASSEVELLFELRDDVPSGVALDSAFLTIYAAPVGDAGARLAQSFRLVKRWQATGAAAGHLTRIALRPVGEAAKLGPSPSYALPPAVVAPPSSPPVVPIFPGRGRTASAPPTTVSVSHGATASAVAVREKLPASRELVHELPVFPFGIREDDRKLGAEGPSDGSIDLLDGLAVDRNVGLSADEILNIDRRVYQDKNAASGIFYFLPHGYHTEWNPETGYGLRMLYGAAKTAGAAGEVAIAARLEAGVDLGESQLAHELLAAYARRHPQTTFAALRPLPIDEAEVSLAGGLQQYSIPAEKIVTVAISDVLGQVEISCVTDTITKENLQLALVEDVGLNGAVKFTPSGGKLAAQQVPLAVRLAEPATFGRLRWARDEVLQNRTPYPLRLRYVHALIINPQTQEPIIYSWSLAGTEVAPGGRVAWEASRVPSWVDRDAKRMWVDYAPVAKCRSCDERVIAEITGGVTSVAASQMIFHTITPLADTGAYELTVHVRSNYFDPQVREPKYKSLLLSADGKDFTLGPIYLGEREPDQVVPGQPLVEYAIDVAMKDGTIHKGTQWLGVDGLRVLIGTAQIQASLGFLPGKKPPSPP
jgi:hypothetical protein